MRNKYLEKKIKLFEPSFNNLELNEVIKIIKSGFWASGAGIKNVKKFELEFKKYVGSKTCIAVNSGTAALNLALSLLDIKNKEVIVPSLTFVSTVHAILKNGGIPIFADIEPESLCIDPNSIKKNISKKTKAILPVHFGGISCNMTDISRISKEHDLGVIEDAAHAAGTKFKNKMIGKHSLAVCFSFHPVKNLAMPNGGLISLNHKNFVGMRKKLEARRWCGITDRIGTKYDVKESGDNYYMNEISASIGLIQLKKLNKLNVKRRKIASKYHKGLNLETKMPYDCDSSYHLYWILVKNRKQFMNNMEKVGIETGIHYKPVHQLTMYKNNIHLPVTEKISKNIVSIPIHANLDNENVEKIISNVNKFV
jgi:perosamine synthetase